MRISIRYLTTYTYDSQVSESHNALRACPASTPYQRVVGYNVWVDPESRIVSYQDYWGTRVDSFGVVGRHTRLTVVADADVETAERPEPVDTAPWPVASTERTYEYLTPTPHVSWNSTVRDFAAEAAADATTYMGAVLQIRRAVGDLLTYVPGSTEVGTSIDHIFETRKGVCQDYAHLALAAYRSLDMPARYVSGYLYAADSSSGLMPQEEQEIVVATHAWVEVWLPDHGWWGVDPTNQLAAGERHVKIGHGRDYEDVTPLRGTYHGEVEAGGLEATVVMSRRGLETYAMTPRPPFPKRESPPHQQQ